MMMARVAAAGLLLGLLAAPAFAAESYEAKEAYDHHHAPAPHAKKAYGHRHSFESVCLEETGDKCFLSQNTCNITPRQVPNTCADIFYYSQFQCCTKPNGARTESVRTKQAAQMLELFAGTEACVWDFTFSLDNGFVIIREPDVSGIDSPGVLPIGKAVGKCYFSDDLKCGPFCNGMALDITADVFLTFGVSPNTYKGCSDLPIPGRAGGRKSDEGAVATFNKLTALMEKMGDELPSAKAATAEADKAPESYSKYVDPPAHKSHHYDPLAGGAGSFDKLYAGIFAIMSGSFVGSIDGVKDPELAGRVAFTPAFQHRTDLDPLIPTYLGKYPNLPLSRAGQLNLWFAHDEESAY